MYNNYYPVLASDKVSISGRFDVKFYGCRSIKLIYINAALSALAANADYTVLAQMGDYAPRTSLNKVVFTNTGKRALLSILSDGSVSINFNEAIEANERLYICEFFI